MDLTDAQWGRIAYLLPARPRRKDGKGRPWSDPRNVLNGVLRVLRTGAPWKDLPDRYPSPSTCHRWFQEWTKEGVWPRVLHELSKRLDLSETFVDATFVPAKKGGHWSVPRSGGKEAKLWLSQAVLAIHAVSPSRAHPPAEVTLVEEVLSHRFTRSLPARIIGDKAYDSDPLDARLRKRGIALIAPHKENRVRATTQDGRVLRRYRRRWKVERFFAWLFQFRRLVTRWEYHAANFLGFAQLGCMLILLRRAG